MVCTSPAECEEYDRSLQSKAKSRARKACQVTSIFVFILAFFAAEGLWVTLTGRPHLRKKLGIGREDLYDDIKERSERIGKAMDRIRNPDRDMDRNGARGIGPTKKVLRSLPPKKL